MTPSQARIDAALRLAEADDAWYGSTDREPEPGWCESSKAHFLALKAYRATLPKLRTRAEVDADIVRVVRSQDGLISAQREHYLLELCGEPLAPEENK